MPICLHLGVTLVLLWYLPKGGFLLCPPQIMVESGGFAHTEASEEAH